MSVKSLLDPSFVYRKAAITDVRITFARARRELEEAKSQRERESDRKRAIVGDSSIQAAPGGCNGQ